MKEPSAQDKAVEKLVAEKLRASAGAPGSACPDAEILAAYLERTLAPKERAAWEVHFDSCKNCQARISALARMDEADDAGRAVAPAAPRAATRRILGLRWAWAAPVFLTILIAGLWYTGELQPLLHQNVLPSPRVSSRAGLPVKPPAAVGKVKEETPAAVARKQQAIGRSTSRAANQVRAATESAPPRPSNAPSAKAPTQTQTESAPLERLRTEGAEKARAGARPSAREQKPAPPANTQEAVAPLAGRNAPAPETTRESSIAGAAVAGGIASRGEPKRASSAGEESRSMVAAPSPAIQSEQMKTLGAFSSQKSNLRGEGSGAEQAELKVRAGAGFHYGRAPAGPARDAMASPSALWRVGPHGLIQKQGAEGEWRTKTSGVTDNLLDISFSGSTIGWAVGQGGVVLRSMNGGETWDRVASPTNQDLIRVTATGADSATVSTRDGRIFSTDDGGVTWKAVSGPP